MTVEFIGSLSNTSPRVTGQSRSLGGSGLAEDPGFPARIARAHEEAGFDRILVSASAAAPDGLVVSSQVLGATDHLGVLLAHRPGLTAPTVVARQTATLDAFYPGRVAIHIITGGDEHDLNRDGDFLDKPSRYARTDEFLTVLRKEWIPDEPFDYEGRFYRVADATSTVCPPPGRVKVYFGGASSEAVPVGARHADTYAFWGEPLAGVAERMAAARDAAAAQGRTLGFSVSLRPIAGETEEDAWERAHRILEVEQNKSNNGRSTAGVEGSQRLQRFAAEKEIFDKCLWMPLATVPNAYGNATALVGSYEQVAEALLDYIAIGATTLLINGYEPDRDIADCGKVISIVREREAQVAPASVGA